MKQFDTLLAGNRAWASATRTSDPAFFERLASGQSPRYFWVGCADSRVPATQICGLEAGSVFVQRNVANQVLENDANCNAALQYAVEVLKIEELIVCGHLDCGGVRAALEGGATGVVAEWLGPLRSLALRKAADLDALPEDQRMGKLCEWNVMQQVATLGSLPIVQAAWERGQRLVIHGLLYGVGDGVLNDLGVGVSSPEQAAALAQQLS